ncbi:MAG: porin family protein [Devosia sp.]|uniref:outer membrane protein n=1 Tax=Devosia sp. TaxID=1871048 RepID=UPI0026132D08|nr:outer membrane beta-barrel protein [Devosia sp.]MDB5542546.1 porin family protein [Devosia sp.]
MSSLNKLILTSVVILGFGGAAVAADAMPIVDAPVYGVSQDWSGFYVGVMGGGGLLTANVPGEQAVYYGSYYGNIDASAFGGTVGVGVGANIQTGSFVLGFDGDINWSSLSADVNADTDHYNSSAKWDWFATLRAKAGIAVDNALVYATAGVAAVNATYGSCFNPDCSPADGIDYTSTQTVWGIAVGAGAEMMVSDNLSVKGEVLYIALPNSEFAVPYDTAYQAIFASNAVIARVGLNWSF